MLYNTLPIGTPATAAPTVSLGGGNYDVTLDLSPFLRQTVKTQLI